MYFGKIFYEDYETNDIYMYMYFGKNMVVENHETQAYIFSNLCLLLSDNGFPYLAVALTALQTCFLSVAD